jgi:acyl dehydratase
MTSRFAGPAQLLEQAGADLGTSDWMIIDEARIDAFADVTGDHQWIHVDPERAKAGPFGTTVAHATSPLAWHRSCCSRSWSSTASTPW